jgi:pimeloyl-ACP methyl ester carboxylesterase
MTTIAGSIRARRTPAEYVGGAGEPLVLLHGLGGSWRIWEPVIERLERHHQVIALTLRGHHGGEPVRRGAPLSVIALVDDIEQRLRRLRVEQPHLAGNSLGGWISLELARRGLAASVVALSPAGAWDPDVGIAKMARRARAARNLGLLMGVHRWSLLSRPQARRNLLRVAIEHGDRMPAAAAAAFLADSAGCTGFPALSTAFVRDGPLPGPVTAACPIRIAWAQLDRVIPFEPYGRLMLELVPGAEFIRMPGVGHIPMYDDPSLVARTILAMSPRA